ncbi:hypothetical protein Ancab_012623 [Ancistrocladus abbreviatus]
MRRIKVAVMEERSMEAEEADRRIGTVDLAASTDVVINIIKMEPISADMGLGSLGKECQNSVSRSNDYRDDVGTCNGERFP